MHGLRAGLLVMGALVAGVVGGSLGQRLEGNVPAYAHPDALIAPEIRAPRVVIVGKDGRPQAVLGGTMDGGPSLALLDHEGQTRATLGLSDTGDPGLL